MKLGQGNSHLSLIAIRQPARYIQFSTTFARATLSFALIVVRKDYAIIVRKRTFNFLDRQLRQARDLELREFDFLRLLSADLSE